MPICPEHAASTSPVRGSLVAGQPLPFSARIVWDDQSSVSNHHDDCEQCRRGMAAPYESVSHHWWQILTNGHWESVWGTNGPWRRSSLIISQPPTMSQSIRFPIFDFLWVLHWNRYSISNEFPDIQAQMYRIKIMTFWSQVTSSETWSFDLQYALSYRWCMKSSTHRIKNAKKLYSVYYWNCSSLCYK